MARTLIGEIILRLKDEVSGKAKTTAQNFETSVDRMERSMRHLGQSDWGARFEQQLKKLGAAPGEVDKLRDKWRALQKDMTSGGIAGTKGAKTMESNFKLAALSEFAAYRAGWEQNVKDAEKWSKTMRSRMQTALQPLLIAGGGYTGAYVVSTGVRASIAAASDEQRERARQHFAGLPEGEQAEIERLSGELSAEFRVAQADAMEIMREARLAMPSAEAAFGSAKEMVQGYKMLGLSFGPEQAITGLRAFNKAMDNINITEDSDLYKKMLDAFVRAQQITGADMDPRNFAQAIKYSRAAGKIFSPEFMQNMLPFLIAETGGSDTGTQLRATFDNFVGGTASKAALNEQQRLGLRDNSGLVDPEGFAFDPLKWVNDHLAPALEKDGVDLSSGVDIAQAVQKIASNRMARSFMQTALTQRDVYLRLSEMMQSATGLEGASQIDALDPYSAFKGFKDAFSNLGAAVVPAEAIASGLNTLADGINRFQQAYRDGDMEAKLGLAAGVGATAYGGYTVGKMIFGLTTAGTNLNAAATSLQAAAASLKGGAAADAAGDIGKAKGGGILAGLAGIAKNPAMLLPLMLSGDTRQQSDLEKRAADAMYRRQSMELYTTSNYQRGKSVEESEPTSIGDFLKKILWGAAADPDFNFRDAMKIDAGITGSKEGASSPYLAELDRYKQKAAETASDVETSLSVTAKPQIDDSSLRSTAKLLDSISSKLSAINALTGEVASRANTKIQREMNRNFSDHGVAP